MVSAQPKRATTDVNCVPEEALLKLGSFHGGFHKWFVHNRQCKREGREAEQTQPSRVGGKGKRPSSGSQEAGREAGRPRVEKAHLYTSKPFISFLLVLSGKELRL